MTRHQFVEHGRQGGLTAARRMTKTARKARAHKAVAARWARYVKNRGRTMAEIQAAFRPKPKPLPTVIETTDPAFNFKEYLTTNPPGLAGVIVRIVPRGK